MIKYNKEEISNEEYLLVKQAQKNAIKCMKHFFSLLDLDPELFNHLYKINIYIDKTSIYTTDDIASAFYISLNNEIHVFQKTIDIILKKEKKFGRESIILYLTSVLIHEYLHSNRDIFLNNPITKYHLNYFKKNNYKKYEELYKNYGHLITNKKNKEVLSIKEHSNYYEIIAYSHYSDHFYIYKMSKNKKYNYINIFKNINKIINSVKLIQENNCKITNIYYCNPHDDYQNITQYDYNSHKQLFYMNYNERIKSRRTINKQENIEEILIDYLANIITQSGNKSYIYIGSKESYRRINGLEMYDIGVYLYNELGIDFIKWFLLSCYNDYYKNKLKEIYKEKYQEVLTKLSKIYESYKNREEISQYRINATKKSLKLKK